MKKMTITKIIGFIILFCGILLLPGSTFMVRAAEDEFLEESLIHPKEEYRDFWTQQRTYPVYPGDGQWEKMSFVEQLCALNIPEDLISDFTDEELAALILRYPFLVDIPLFESSEQAMLYFFDTSNIFRYYFSRSDAVKSLLNMVHDSDDFINNYLVHELLAICYDYYCENLETDENIDIEFLGNDTQSILISDGFYPSSSTYTHPNWGVTYTVGTYYKYGTSTGCLEYYSGGNTTTLQSDDNAFYATHSSWTRVYTSSYKYNCHSYAWINASSSNTYWLNDPDNFATSASFSHINKNGSANANDRIIIRDSSGNPIHSVIVNSYGSNLNSIHTTSKCGAYGVYDAYLVDMVILYSGNYYDVYR